MSLDLWTGPCWLVKPLGESSGPLCQRELHTALSDASSCKLGCMQETARGPHQDRTSLVQAATRWKMSCSISDSLPKKQLDKLPNV